jgi:hypothetical protein
MPDSNKGLAKKEQFINNLFAAYIKLTFPIQGSGSLFDFLRVHQIYFPETNFPVFYRTTGQLSWRERKKRKCLRRKNG